MVPNEETVSHEEDSVYPTKIHYAQEDAAVIDTGGLERAVEAACRHIDDLREQRDELLAVAREFVALYDGVEHLVGKPVAAKLARARAAIAKATVGGAR